MSDVFHAQTMDHAGFWTAAFSIVCSKRPPLADTFDRPLVLACESKPARFGEAMAQDSNTLVAVDETIVPPHLTEATSMTQHEVDGGVNEVVTVGCAAFEMLGVIQRNATAVADVAVVNEALLADAFTGEADSSGIVTVAILLAS